ncbi:hypothetical protein Plhal703r1_c15g0074741 [Plasmopara halstedii]
MLMDNHAPTVYVYLCPVQEICVVVESQIVRAKIHCCFVKSHEFLGLASYLTFSHDQKHRNTPCRFTHKIDKYLAPSIEESALNL